MTTQSLVVFSVVLACSVYALWVLMPAALRRVLARQLLRLPLGASLKAALQQTASRTGGCDCSGCDKVVDLKRQGETHVIRFHPKTKEPIAKR